MRDRSGPHWPDASGNTEPLARVQRQEVRSVVRFHSILFDQPVSADTLASEAPACFADLNLDQMVDALTAGREEYDLKPFLYAPLHDVESVQYRHDILRDLENTDVFTCVTSFARQMRRVRQHLAQAEQLYYKYQKERWFLDGVALYCEAVRTLATELTQVDARSRGFQAFRAYLSAYVSSDSFGSLAAEARKLQDDLAAVRYCVHIQGSRITVSGYGGESDYSADVAETFARFRQGNVKDYRVALPDPRDMNHVEAHVLDFVARLNPEVFEALDQYCARHRAYLDDTIRAFDREVQVYLAYLAYIKPFQSVGLPFCYPEVSSRSKVEHARDTFDIALAAKLVPEQATVVCNDFALSDPERIIVVTGPNQGGKTTFARLFGQLHYLASLGLSVPGSTARIFLPDQILTHFEQEEDLSALRGKLEDELVRMHTILGQATADSVLILNESFASTTLHDTLFLGTEVLRQIVALDALCVYVTFVDELSALGETVVSMVSTVVPENPAQRTYKIIRQPANGLAYAEALAEKYGLTYDALSRRIAARAGAGRATAG